MKLIIICLVLLLVTLGHVKVHAQDHCQSLQTPYQEILSNALGNLAETYDFEGEPTADSQNVLQADVYYGIFKVGTANIDMSFGQDRIEAITLGAHIVIKPLFVNEHISEQASFEQFASGQNIPFGLKKASAPLLTIVPGNDIDQTGGSSTLEIRGKDRIIKENIYLKKDQSGNFAFYLNGTQEKDRVTGLKINVGGMLPEVFIKSYSVSTLDNP